MSGPRETAPFGAHGRYRTSPTPPLQQHILIESCKSPKIDKHNGRIIGTYKTRGVSLCHAGRMRRYDKPAAGGVGNRRKCAKYDRCSNAMDSMWQTGRIPDLSPSALGIAMTSASHVPRKWWPRRCAVAGSLELAGRQA